MPHRAITWLWVQFCFRPLWEKDEMFCSSAPNHLSTGDTPMDTPWRAQTIIPCQVAVKRIAISFTHSLPPSLTHSLTTRG